MLHLFQREVYYSMVSEEHMDKIYKMIELNKGNKLIRLIKCVISSLAIYYAFCIKVEELFWLVCGIVLCTYCTLEKDGRHRGKDLKQRVVFGIVSCYIALCLTLGLCYYEEAGHSTIQWIIIFAGLFILFYEGMGYIYDILCRVSLRQFVLNARWSKGRRILVWSALLLFAGWVPMLLANYPGILMYDSTEQWFQAVGEWSWSNHHPVCHTVIVWFSTQICKLICGEVIAEYSVLIYSLIQMAIMAVIFSVVIEWLYQAGIPKVFWLGGILYYLILPIHAIHSVSMVKDSLFGTFVLLFTAQIFKLYYSEGEWGKSWKNMIALTITMMGVAFFRNNGFAVIMISGPVLFFVFKKIRKQILIAGFIVAACFLLQNIVVFRAMDIRQTQLAEAIGIPINQIANVVCHDRELTENEKILIEAVMPIEAIKDSYSIRYSDSIKFNENYKGYVVEQSKKTYFKLWVTLLLKYPMDCMEAFLNLTIGFWYPGVSKGVVSVSTMDDEDMYLQKIGIDTENLKIRSDIFDTFAETGIRENVLFSGFFSIGNTVILMFLLCAFLIARKGWKIVIIFLPCITVWLTLLAATPSFCETRYIYSIFATVPVFFAVFGKEMFLFDKREE